MKVVLACALAMFTLQSVPPSYPPPFPREGISKVFENERMVVWQGVLGIRGEPTKMHRHEFDLVGVFLDDGQVRTQTVDGAVRDGSPFGRGAAVFQPRGVIHTEEVLVDGTRAVGIELKSAAPSSTGETIGASATNSEARVIVDNARVLIREFAWSPTRPLSRDSLGRDVVLIPLESGHIRQTDPRGVSRVERLVFGHVIAKPSEGAVVETAQAGTPRAVVVELK